MKKFFLIAFAALIVLALSAHFVWKYSGSNQWKLVSNKSGIQIYSMKVPGSTTMRFKGITRFPSRLDPVVALLLDPGACDLGGDGCYASLALQKVDEQRGGAGYYSFKWKYPFHFQPRQYVVKTTFSQDPRSGEVFEAVEAAPDMLPPDDCCHRIQHMVNTWRLKPVQNGQVELEYVVDAPGEGFFPYVLDNLGGPEYMHYILSEFPGWLKSEKYQKADVAFVARKS